MNSDTISILIIILCVIASGYFSATETAFSSLNRIRIKNMAEKGNRRARLVLRLEENYDSLLSTILIGNNIVNIACASLATVLFVKLLGGEAGPGLSTAVTTVIVLIFGEISPKSIAKESPERFAMFSAPIINFLRILLTPVNLLFRLWKMLLSRLFKSQEDRSITEEELLTIVEEAEQEGGINEQEGSLIRSAIEFTEQEAIDILTPRIDIAAVPEDAEKEEIARVFAETGYSRLPVYRESIDDITGIIYQKDFHNQIYHTRQPLSAILRPPLFITRNRKIGELLRELQQKKSHIAVVVDEFGGTTGIVTLEDILEELVGEIWDEHDEVVQEVRRVSDRVYLVKGSANADKLFELLELEEETEFSTVSGWVMEMLGHVPRKGDQFHYQNLQVSVLEMDGNRVETVRVELEPPEEVQKDRQASD